MYGLTYISMVRKSERAVKTESVFMLANWLSETKKEQERRVHGIDTNMITIFLDRINKGINEDRCQTILYFYAE